MNKINKLKQKIVEAQPKKIWVFPHIGEHTRVSITLEDVLITWRKQRLNKNPNFEFGIMSDTYKLTELLDIWTYGKNLSEQSKETKELLTKLLV